MRCSTQNRLIRLPKYQNVRYKKLICGKIWGMICSVIFGHISYHILSCCILLHCHTVLSYQLSYHIVVPHRCTASLYCIVYRTVVLIIGPHRLPYYCPVSLSCIVTSYHRPHHHITISCRIIVLHHRIALHIPPYIKLDE